MATPASRMMLSRNTKSLYHLLRARLSGASTTINIPAAMSSAQVHHQDSNFVKYLLGYQSAVSSSVNNESANIGLILGQSFGEMGLIEARGKKVVVDDEDDGSSGEDHDEDICDEDDNGDDDDDWEEEEEEEEEDDWDEDDDGKE